MPSSNQSGEYLTPAEPYRPDMGSEEDNRETQRATGADPRQRIDPAQAAP